MDGFKRPNSSSQRMMPPTGRPEGFVPHPTSSIPAENRPQPLPPAPAPATPAPDPQGAATEPMEIVPLDSSRRPSSEPPRRRKRLRRVIIFLTAILGVVVLIGAALAWGVMSLRPVSHDKNVAAVSLDVVSGSTWSSVAKTLAEKGAIRNDVAFTLYARLHRDALPQATCFVSPADSSQEIIAQISSGCKNTSYVSVTFYPGATIETPLYKPANSQIDASAMSARNVLKKAGYSDEEIDAALNASYDGGLFADKPAGTSLEGYIYGDTYHIAKGASATSVLQMAFDHMHSDITKYDLIDQYKTKEGLTLYQGITLASIVQRELNCEDKPTLERKDRCYQYQRSIAQVFLTRLKSGMTLGSDVTFIYAADQLKVQPSPTLESPYNTRIHPGLPPGPIATPGLLALRAVADPTPTDYLYFIAGDDGLIYFAKTDAEHQANIKNHCQQLCSEL